MSDQMRLRRRNAAVFLIAMVPVVAAAQQFLSAPPGAPVDPNTRFEVVAIKAGEGSGLMTMRSTPGHFEALNVPLGLPGLAAG
jgi:hypothetical protein